MPIEIYIAAFITLAYSLFIGLAILGFLKLKKSVANTTLTSAFISIVVSARNEEETIIEFIRQINLQSFPKKQFEIILIDDASEDKTYALAKQELEKSGLNYKLIQQEYHQGKKKNIAQAVEFSKGSIIITTDADIVSRPKNWISTIANCFENNAPDMLIMPLDFESESGFLAQFQIFENIALTGITAGYVGIKKPFLCNGANLAFKKSSYEVVNGYISHQQISSGEDVFLLESLKKIKHSSIHYLLSKDVIVKTKPQNSMLLFFYQRLRWAYKAKYSSNWLNMSGGIATILSNFLLLVLCIALFKKPSIVPYLSIFVLVKLVFDFLLLFLAASFLGRLRSLKFIVPFSLLYWLYAFLIGIISLFYKPYWKGKKIN